MERIDTTKGWDNSRVWSCGSRDRNMTLSLDCQPDKSFSLEEKPQWGTVRAVSVGGHACFPVGVNSDGNSHPACGTAPFHWLSQGLIKKGASWTVRMHSTSSTLDRGVQCGCPSSSSCALDEDAFLLRLCSWLECNVTSCFKLLQPWLLYHDKALPPRLPLVSAFSQKGKWI